MIRCSFPNRYGIMKPGTLHSSGDDRILPYLHIIVCRRRTGTL